MVQWLRLHASSGGGPSSMPGQGTRSRTASEVRGGGWEELPHTPTPEAGGDGWEEQPHVQGTVAAPVQEALEELSHAEGQEGWQ